jgi:hypothetical protein
MIMILLSTMMLNVGGVNMHDINTLTIEILVSIIIGMFIYSILLFSI